MNATRLQCGWPCFSGRLTDKNRGPWWVAAAQTKIGADTSFVTGTFVHGNQSRIMFGGRIEFQKQGAAVYNYSAHVSAARARGAHACAAAVISSPS